MSRLEQTAQQLIESGLVGLGEKKLAALELDLLTEIVQQLGVHVTEDATVDALVKVLMKKKRNKQVKLPIRPTTELAPTKTKVLKPVAIRPKAPPTQAESCLSEPADEATQTPQTTSPTSVADPGIFKVKHKLEFIVFNALKLRVFRDDLKDQFQKLVERFALADVIVMSEVSNLERAKEFLSYLNRFGEWQLRTSTPSKPSNEVHAFFVKASIRLIRQVTTMAVGTRDFSHAPFTLLLQDKNLGRFVVSSVHFPPQSKAAERDLQIRAFVKAYTEESALRCDTPITEKGAKDAKAALPVHMIAGDFNCWPGAPEYGLEERGFTPLLGKHVSTTSGKQAFDNALVTENAKHKFAIASSVLELANPQNSHRGEIGLSDHSPVSFRFEL